MFCEGLYRSGEFLVEPGDKRCRFVKVRWDFDLIGVESEAVYKRRFGFILFRAIVRLDKSLELTSLKLVDLKKRALICDTFIPFGWWPVWAHPNGLNVGFGAGHVEFMRLDKEIIELSEKMDFSEVDINYPDLFTAAMFEMFRGRKHVMDDAIEDYFHKWM